MEDRDCRKEKQSSKKSNDNGSDKIFLLKECHCHIQEDTRSLGGYVTFQRIQNDRPWPQDSKLALSDSRRCDFYHALQWLGPGR